MNKVTVTYGKGIEAMDHAVSHAINSLLSENIPKEEIKIYMSPLTQKFFQEELRRLMMTHSFIPGMKLRNFMGVDVVSGYETNAIIVAWERGEYFDIPPRRITYTVERVEEKQN